MEGDSVTTAPPNLVDFKMKDYEVFGEVEEATLLKNYLTGEGLPHRMSAKAKKRIKRKSAKYGICTIRGKPCLVYKGEANAQREVVVDKDERHRILYRLHDENGHLGRNSSRAAIKKHYYWRGMVYDIDEYVHSCEYCKGISNGERKLRKGIIKPAVKKEIHISLKRSVPQIPIPQSDSVSQIHIPQSDSVSENPIPQNSEGASQIPTPQKKSISQIPIPKSESVMTCHALRLRPGDELKSKLLDYVQEHNLRAAFILTCVGSLRTASIRLADSVSVINLDKNHEIVSLTGTLSGGHGHLHISLSDEEGKVVGGHLMGDAKIFTTAEVVIGELHQLKFCREPDEDTGYSELKIDKR